MPDAISLVIFTVVILLLIYAGYSDLRRLRIPNWISIVLVLAFLPIAATLPWPEIYSRLIIVAVVFGIGLALFAMNTLGAGDVKLLAALLLFVQSQQAALFFLLLSATLLIGLTAVVLVRKMPVAQRSNFKALATPGVFPMGVSISSAGLICLSLPLALV